MTEILDGTAEEAELVHEEAHEPEPPVTTAVARRERRSEVIRPLAADQLVESFKEYQELLPQLLADDDYQAAGRGKRFVKKSGWRKIATAFDLDVQIIRSAVDRGEMTRPSTCDRCGADARIEAHHADYAKPLEVEWLCFPCHRALHIEAGTYKSKAAA